MSKIQQLRDTPVTGDMYEDEQGVNLCFEIILDDKQPDEDRCFAVWKFNEFSGSDEFAPCMAGVNAMVAMHKRYQEAYRTDTPNSNKPPYV